MSQVEQKAGGRRCTGWTSAAISLVGRPVVVPAAVFAFVAVSALGVTSAPIAAQAPTGLEIGVVPAVNFDSDEGFGYGIVAELYQYGDGGVRPYAWTVQPTVFLTTEGRRDVTLFFDAPSLWADRWRLSAYAGRQKQIATPYYGIGNATPYDETLEADDGPDPFYYRFGSVRTSLTVDLQYALEEVPVRILFGTGFERVNILPVPDGQGTTLYASDHGPDETTTWVNYIRGGIVWDSRDRESGPTSGTWTEFLVRATDESLAADVQFIRWTLTDRRYFRLTERLVFAHRYLVQHVSSGAPTFELFPVQTSFKQQEGLGGAKTVRGILRNRYIGQGMLVWNAELRWRAVDFRLVGRDFHAVLSAFLDQGRVWADGFDPEELFEDLHRGYGGGVRVGMGENFVVALDAGTSNEAGLGLYIGLGYLY